MFKHYKIVWQILFLNHFFECGVSLPSLYVFIHPKHANRAQMGVICSLFVYPRVAGSQFLAILRDFYVRREKMKCLLGIQLEPLDNILGYNHLC